MPRSRYIAIDAVCVDTGNMKGGDTRKLLHRVLLSPKCGKKSFLASNWRNRAAACMASLKQFHRMCSSPL